ncbi:MAG TPA: prolyl oligopeptidase family serine peptidase [Caulobacteraceae bacterium]|jgi:dipeptidyl aminopeptidase/acylaminoacyl peptidase|nr:prolyl oligopeptidase family serine peptidase [Caulobacteraceae bacterium]
MADPIIAPYGAWSSPITAQSLTANKTDISDLRVIDGRLFWTESDPRQGGRLTLVTEDGRGGVRALTPQSMNVRTRVHEYGGAPYVVVGDRIFFSNFADQRLYVAGFGGAPRAVTPQGYRYADFTTLPGGAGVICVRQDHTDPVDVKNALVLVSCAEDDAGRVLYDGSDFVAYPRISPDGRRLAFMAWNHPNMPWDDTALYVGDLVGSRLSNVRQVAGGASESVTEPRWAPGGALFFASDRTNFWNLYTLDGQSARSVAPREAEFAGPLWQLGQANYAFLDNSRMLARYSEGGQDHLVLVDPARGAAREIALPFIGLRFIQRVDADRAAMLALSVDALPAIVVVDVTTGAYRTVRSSGEPGLSANMVSHAQQIAFPTAGGRTAYANFYEPKNPGFRAPAGTKPPLLVLVHGGPTGQASPSFNPTIQFWTTRGFAVADVDYGGSSGYGRAYRQSLNGQWGVVDVEDVVAAAKYLGAAGKIDPDHAAIRGGSAGGYTVLGALSQTNVFKAGADYYGVSDMTALARDTHKFESRYTDNLIGPLPEAQAVYDARSPLNHLDGFSAPLIVFQGAEDPIVPPNQSRMIVDALRQRGSPVAYMQFAKEGHGFRRAESIVAALNAELAFYGRVFGFKPADKLPPLHIDNLPD